MKENSNILTYQKNAKILISIADEKRVKGDKEGALLIYLEVERLSKFPIKIYREIAHLYTELQMYSESICYWFKYLNFVSKRHYAEAYNGLGGNYYLAGMHDVSAYYFNMQINCNGDAEFIYDDYLYELLANESEDEGLKKFKVIDTRAEADKQKIATAKKIYEKNPEEAYNLLNSINQDSNEYENAIITLAAFYMIDEKYEEAIKCYSSIPEFSENYDYALNNKFGAQFCALDIQNALITMEIIKKRDCAHFEQLVKFFYLIRSLGDNELNYLYAEHLRNVFTTPNIYYYSGVSAYNVSKFNEAKDWFFAYYKLTGHYYALYAKLAAESHLKGEKKFPNKLSYNFALNETEVKSLHETAQWHLSKSDRKLRKNASEIFEFANSCFSTNSLELQLIACQLLSIIGGIKAEKYLKALLLNPNIGDNFKTVIVQMLVEMGNDKLTGVVYGNVYSRLPFEKIEFPEINQDLFLSAYAKAYARFSIYDESELYKLKISTYEIYYKLQANGNLRKVNDQNALSAYICVNAGIEIDLLPETIIEYMDSTVEKVNKIIKLTKSE